MSNTNHRVQFYYRNDPQIFEEAWNNSSLLTLDDWVEQTQKSFDQTDADADKMLIEREKARREQDKKELDFNAEMVAEARNEPYVRFAGLCRRLYGFSDNWARKHGAPRVKMGKTYQTKMSWIEKWYYNDLDPYKGKGDENGNTERQ